MFTDRLKMLRMRQGLTQAVFATEFGVSSGTTAMWETGKRMPDMPTIVRLADFFNVSTDYLLDHDTPSEGLATDNEVKYALYGTLDDTDDDYELIKKMAAEQQRIKQLRKK